MSLPTVVYGIAQVFVKIVVIFVCCITDHNAMNSIINCDILKYRYLM